MRKRSTKVDGIVAELVCPQCRYSLQGLDGRIVVCPECGAASEIAKMVMERWDLKIYEVPYYGQAVRPVVVATIGLPLVALLVSSAAAIGWAPAIATAALGGFGITLLAWVLEMRRVSDAFGRREGLRVVLALHGVMLAYALVPTSLLATWFWVWPWWSGESQLLPSYVVVLPFVAVPLALLARRSDRRVALRCVEQYLAAPASQEPIVVRPMDMICPGCEANLTGQRGETITCPACGMQSALESVVRGRPEDDAEAKALYKRMNQPFACAAAGLIVATLSGLEAVSSTDPSGAWANTSAIVALALITGAIVGCVWGMFRVVSEFGQPGVAIGLALVGVNFVQFMVIPAVLLCVAPIYFALVGEWPTQMSIVVVIVVVPIVLVGGVLLALVAKRGERWVMRVCRERSAERGAAARVADVHSGG